MLDINALKASKRVGINIATVKIERKTTKDIGTKTKKPIKVSKKQLNCGNMGKARIKSAIGIKKHSKKPVKASNKTKLRKKGKARIISATCFVKNIPKSR